MDIPHRKTWDSCTDEAKVFETEEDGTDLVYWRVHFPRLMAKRDYVFARRYCIKRLLSSDWSHCDQILGSVTSVMTLSHVIYAVILGSVTSDGTLGCSATV